MPIESDIYFRVQFLSKYIYIVMFMNVNISCLSGCILYGTMVAIKHAMYNPKYDLIYMCVVAGGQL